MGPWNKMGNSKAMETRIEKKKKKKAQTFMFSKNSFWNKKL